jgi:hypothetical protein
MTNQWFSRASKFFRDRFGYLPEKRQKVKSARRNTETAFNGVSKRIAGAVVSCCLLIFVSLFASAQDMSTGALNVTVLDPTGAVVNGAQLVLKDTQTNNIHKAVSRGTGGAVFSFLNPAPYSLTVTKDGFNVSVFPSVTIQTNQVTNLKVMLEVGSTAQSVTVSAESSPLMDTTQNALSTTLDLKQVDDLPLSGRDAFGLAYLSAGSVDDNFNNLPGGAVNVSSNGFSTMTDRFKSAGFDSDGSSISLRLEDVQEMTVQTGELDASKGGSSAMDIGVLTKRGTNEFHGQLYEDYRSGGLNANSWYNKDFTPIQPRSSMVKNDFGGSVGGPILKNKLFVFASLSNYRTPASYTVSTWVPTADVLNGIYSYYPMNPDGSQSTTATAVNVLQAGASAGCSTCTSTINTLIAGDLAKITSSYADLTKYGGISYTKNEDLNHDMITFPYHGSTVDKYPTMRVDYNLSPKFRLTGAVNATNNYNTNQSGPPYPGSDFSNLAYSTFSKNYQVVAGFDWDIKPNLVNAFRAGYLYTGFTYNSQGMNSPTAAMMEQGDLALGLSINSGVNGFASLKGGSLYPILQVKDDVTWQRGRHTISFGVQSATEIDHYYNNQFVPYIGANYIATGDPVQNALDSAIPSAQRPTYANGDIEGLYATLNGRMTYYSLGEFINAKTKKYEPGISFNLHEKLSQTALFVEDSWRIRPTVTLNVGLRWDFAGASKDETGFYTHPNIANMWGPTPVGDIFKPGSLGGVANPVEGPASEAYAPTYVHPQPNVGVAWNPGNGATVFRASYTFKNYTEGAQTFWNFGSNNGANFNNWYYADPQVPSASTPSAGYYNAGSVLLGGALPTLTTTSPDPYQATITEASQAFSGTSFLTFDPHIKQPYVESWQVGMQRQINASNVVELRYVGNVAKNQWMAVNYNEVNIYENGFLDDFKAAQTNLAASNGTTLKGAQPTPILDLAFASSGGAGYTNGGFISDVQQGQAGAFASTLAGSSTYLCSLVANFDAGLTATGSKPMNFFQANPYAAGAAIQEMENAGFSNYNSLQAEWRQRLSHGMQFNANYTWSHSLGTSVQGSMTPGYYSGRGNSAPSFYTLRNKHLNYFPSSFDVRQVFHLYGTYDLPFGKGQPFFAGNRLANTVIGGWTIGTILTYQTGEPYLFNGSTYTVNGSDSGITLKGVTAAQLEHQIKVRRGVTGKGYVTLFDPKYIATSGKANTQYIGPNFNAGEFGSLMWLHGPKWINTDMSLSKVVPIHGTMNFTLQSEFLNVFNHTAWTGMDTGVQDSTFGTTSSTANAPRKIELRGNFRF